MKKVIHFFPRYEQYAASSRLRIYSLFKYLEIKDYEKRINPFFTIDRFKNRSIKNKILFYFSVFISVIKRVFRLQFVGSNDIVVIQFELIPFFPPFFEKALKKRGVKIILDFDDAFHLSYNSSKISQLKEKYKEIISIADLIITGGPSLTNYMSKINSNVIEIPTTVNDLYLSGNDFLSLSLNDNFIISWIGSSTTSKYIDQIEDVLIDFLNSFKNTRLLLIGYSGDGFKNSIKVVKLNWDENIEKAYLPLISVGIMPLSIDDWTNCKCGFKLIQYMAAGKPTIASPLSANLKIDNGLGNLFAKSKGEWFFALNYFYSNPHLISEVGLRNLNEARLKFTFESVLPLYHIKISELI